MFCGCLENLFQSSKNSQTPKTVSRKGFRFGTIEPHLQLEIVKKLNFDDFKQFDLSSKIGNDLAESVSAIPTLGVDQLVVSEHKIYLELSNRDKSKTVYFAWEKVKDLLDCPRFCVTDRIIINSEEDVLDQVLDAAEDGQIYGSNSGLEIQKSNMSEAQFSKFMELFNIKWVKINSEFNEDVVRSKQFCELDKIILQHPLESSDFTAFRATDLEICVSSSSLNETLNEFLKEWYENKRDIRVLKINLNPESNAFTLNPDVIFSSLPISLLWSLDLHKTSDISHIPINSLWRKLTNNLFYVLQRNNAKLWISIDKEKYICVEKVVDSKLRLEKELSFNIRRRLPCLYDHKRNSCLIHGPNDWCECCYCGIIKYK